MNYGGGRCGQEEVPSEFRSCVQQEARGPDSSLTPASAAAGPVLAAAAPRAAAAAKTRRRRSLLAEQLNGAAPAQAPMATARSFVGFTSPFDFWYGLVAAAYGTDGPYHGLRANVPFWRVDGVHHDEFSMNYIMIGYTLDRSYIPRPGAEPPAKLTNQIIVGLVAWPALYGDSLPRLFVYHTNDGGVNHHCYNHECGGFTLTNNKYALGCSWSGPGSEVGGERRSITLGIHRDDAKLIWWVSVMDVDIGYYSEEAFDTAFPEGSYVEMGGRVLNTRPGGKHTRTPMGNGMPACAGSRFAATIFEYLGVNAGGQLFLDAPDRTVTTTPGCYGAKPIGFSAGRAGYVVAYGGPGGIYCDQPCC
ncbi:hypothetical protein ZWY2020_053653 [Hordeum vulgare]|nr:hypothetical protein ZWY2020_053653 [Hordeum vulgare]